MRRVLTITTLFPNPAQPSHGVFVETRLHEVRKLGDVRFTVVAPVPWWPFSSKHPSMTSIPRRRISGDVEVFHPRYLAVPLVGMYVNLMTLWVALRVQISALLSDGWEFDVLDGHYYFPDGVVIGWIKEWLKLPLMLTARGTDINLIPQHRLARRLILNAAALAEQNIAVCEALKEEMSRIGVESRTIAVYRNGVNLSLFQPLTVSGRERTREDLGLTAFTLVSVGLLTERKGHHLVIDALESLPGVQLLIVGSGELEISLKAQVRDRHLSKRVQFLGLLNQAELRDIYAASDALVLASSREGWANVLLEALACGTPVVATKIWGTPEVIASDIAGVLVDERSAQGIAAGIRELQERPIDRQAIRSFSEKFGWAPVARGLSQLMHSIRLRA